jgi:hypothetical protein
MDMPGSLALLSSIPLASAEKADENTLKRYREAELTHGRVGMLAVIDSLPVKRSQDPSSLMAPSRDPSPPCKCLLPGILGTDKLELNQKLSTDG